MTSMKIVAAIAFIATAWYLLELFLFASRFRSDSKELWVELGKPERFGIAGQTTFLLIALGVKSLPNDVLARYQHRFIRIRILLAVLVVAFIALAIMTSA